MDSVEAMSENNSGGKGASLAQMISINSELNAKIPRGIILTTKAYESHLEGNQTLKEVIEDLQAVSNQLCSEKYFGYCGIYCRGDFIAKNPSKSNHC